MPAPRSPGLTVDVIIDNGDGRVLLIERRHVPEGWALPGGFVEVGETVEAAAIREAKEETGLDVQLVRQYHVYSDPARDPRGHTVAVVFVGRSTGTPSAGDDAKAARWFERGHLPKLAFDHAQILSDYFRGCY